MYKSKDYLNRGMTFVNNQLFPGNKKLSTLMIYATDLCDSACKHCLIWAKRPVNYLPFDKIVEVMKNDCITKNTSIGLEGGEFMLHPDALKILEWFHLHHGNFDVLSNGLKPDKLIDAIKKFPPRRLYISLDGTEDTYLYMRGKPAYNSVLKVINNLKDVLPVSVMFTLSPYNDFTDLQHVAEICKKYQVDLRVGIYNNIAFFDTKEQAHYSSIGSRKMNDIHVGNMGVKTDELSEQWTEELPKQNDICANIYKNFTKDIPPMVKEFKENYDFLVLYNEWRRNNLRLKCYSILDSLVILPNGDVPLCQNLDLKIGNIFEKKLDEIFNCKETIKTQKNYVHNCNQCWLNFHRKYDVVLYRTFEKYFGRFVTTKLFGYYCWEETSAQTYSSYFNSLNDL